MPDEILQDGFTSEDNEVVRQRKEKLTRLITEEGYNPYVNETWDRRDTLDSIRERFEHLQPEEEDASTSLSTAGRVMT
ncbi:MAG: lysine--tRNA ligase, partial [Synergistaceae bacterium]|nr:lysine--tRNA ligase [Synergistaceae bacterium]